MGEGDLKELRELVEFLKASGVAEFDMERPELKVRLTFASATSPQPVTGSLDYAQLAQFLAGPGAATSAGAPSLSTASVAVGSAPSAATMAVSSGAGASSAEEESGLHMVKSPLVGTFYDAPSPGVDTFVRLGDRVSAGKVVCIVEAMKIMNEIECDAAGEIVQVYVKAGQPVEYGQKLFAIRP